MDQQILSLGFLQLSSFLEYVNVSHWSGVHVSLIYQKLVYLAKWKKYG